MRKTTAIELYDFFERLKQLPVTKSAFCQRRKLIKPVFFFDLFKLSSTIFYKQFQYYKTWKNRLLYLTFPADENIATKSIGT
ncbi:hypothetical protein SAMN05444359_13933 [Neolewinella agarilytica]|uniref:Uncharacterized protein n=1 Tax=Neolewinella agarilytica TaxID=478744 RepID=A0A1H9NT49_9BACT|nr:hypothetical protein SAMN05444359_13933 [Neolewinella agarilytica]